MAKEIERKFLVCGDFEPYATTSYRIEQGYIAGSADLTVRVRIRDEEAFLTIKSRSDAAGLERDEWEWRIDVEEANSLLRFSAGAIEKTRYIVPHEGHTFEVDRFYGANEGLVMAEVELCSREEEFARPAWLGEEVTGDVRYYNSQLLKNPFTKWQK